METEPLFLCLCTGCRLTCEGEDLAHVGDAEHLPLDEPISSHGGQQRGGYAAEVRQRRQEAVLKPTEIKSEVRKKSSLFLYRNRKSGREKNMFTTQPFHYLCNS